MVYASRSTALRDANAWIPLRIDLPRGSLSEKLRAGSASDGTHEVDADIWFSDWERGGVLLEEARHFPRWDQTLTMLWFAEEEVPPPKLERELREDEEELPTDSFPIPDSHRIAFRYLIAFRYWFAFWLLSAIR